MMRLRIAAAAVVLVASVQARADTYRVDLIVFLDKYAATESGRAVETPNTRGAVEPGNPVALASAGITLLPDAQFGLAEEWQRLRNAKRYQPLVKLAWTQKEPPAERGPSVRVKFGQSFAVGSQDYLGAASATPVDGSVALLIGQYLRLDADLVYTVPTSGGFVSYKLREARRMKRDELSYFDSPRLGLLAKVSKVQAAP